MLQFYQQSAELYVPRHKQTLETLRSCTHIGIGAHQDDLEFMALHGILECFECVSKGFGGVICTNGSGSAREGAFANYSDEALIKIRAEEQREAARIGDYNFVAQLMHQSVEVKAAAKRKPLIEELKAILHSTQPKIIYTHNPADKHGTHVAVFLACLEAIRSLPKKLRPKQLLGCEVWRGLDWLPDNAKVALPLDQHPGLSEKLNRVFKSQIAGGKRYDLAIEGRYQANATFLNSHQVDGGGKVAYAMDMTPLIEDDSIKPERYVLEFIESLKTDVLEKIKEYT